VLDEAGTRINPSKSIFIADRVWLAENSYVSKGVAIGSDSIVAANAVVTKSVAARTIVAGNPAKAVKSGVTWTRELKAMPRETLTSPPENAAIASASNAKLGWLQTIRRKLQRR
ncbi:MAG: hypothetical protein EOP06_25290, partial [Proteobacteria bacterium]